MYNVHFRVGWNSTIISLKTLRKVLLKGKVQRDFRPPNFLIIWTFLVLWPMDYNIFDLGLRFRLVSSLARPSTCTIVHVCIRTFLYVFTSKYTQSPPNSRIMIANTKNLCMVGQVNKDRWEQTSRHTAIHKSPQHQTAERNKLGEKYYFKFWQCLGIVLTLGVTQFCIHVHTGRFAKLAWKGQCMEIFTPKF